MFPNDNFEKNRTESLVPANFVCEYMYLPG